jgi:hypothetical protein
MAQTAPEMPAPQPPNFEVLPGKGPSSKVYLHNGKLYYYEKTLRGTQYLKCIKTSKEMGTKCQGRGYLYNNEVKNSRNLFKNICLTSLYKNGQYTNCNCTFYMCSACYISSYRQISLYLSLILFKTCS